MALRVTVLLKRNQFVCIYNENININTIVTKISSTSSKTPTLLV